MDNHTLTAVIAMGKKYANEITSDISSDIAQNVTDWLDEHVDPETGYVIDDTLTIQGAAADAKKTGDELTELKNQLDEKFYVTVGKNKIDPDLCVAGALQSDASVATNGTWANYLTSDFIPLEANTDYSFACYDATHFGIYNGRKRICLYDASKTYITGTYQNSEGQPNVTFNSGTSYKYARVSWASNYLAQFEKGFTPSIYHAYTAHTYLNTDLGQVAQESFISTFGEPAKIQKKNLYNANTNVVGLLYSNGVVDNAQTNYFTTDFIKVFSGYTYTISHCRTIATYDTDKQLLSFVAQSSSSEYIYNSVQPGYIRFSATNRSEGVEVVVTYNGNENYKIDEKADLSIRQSESISALIAKKNGNVLYQKKWVVIGDSFTNGATQTTIEDGMYAGERYVYPYLIGNRNEMQIDKFFDGGRTLAFPEVPGTFVNSITNPNADFYYQNIPSDADYITIYLGINDGHHRPGSSGGDGEDNTGVIPIGTLDDQTTATFGGAWNVVLTWLLTNRPNAHIGIIVSNGLDAEDYMTMTINAAKKYGLPYLNLNGDERCRAMIRSQNPNIPVVVKNIIKQTQAVDPSTNTHPNDAAHLLESTFIENFLKSL